MHPGMRRVPAERARHAKRLGHVQTGSGPVVNGLVQVNTNSAVPQSQQPTTAASAPTTQSTAASSAKPSSSTSSPSTQASSSSPSSSASPTSSAPSSASTQPLVSTPPASSSVVTLSVTLPPSSATPSSTSSPQSAAAATSHGLSGSAIAGIIAGSIIVGVALIVFFVRKTYLRRRESKPISWNETPGLGQDLLDEPKSIPDTSDHAPPSPFDPRGRSTYSAPAPPVAPMRPPAVPAYSIPTLPSATYNNPAYLTQPAPLTYGPGNPSAFAMARGAAGAGGGQRAPMEAMVKCTFVPTLPDELSITTGERIFVVEQYDDGWDLCMNARGERGMVPRECLELAPPDQPEVGWKNARRLSSLNPDGNRY